MTNSSIYRKTSIISGSTNKSNDFEFLNGDQFSDKRSVNDLKVVLTDISVEDNVSTKSSSIDLSSPVVTDLGIAFGQSISNNEGIV